MGKPRERKTNTSNAMFLLFWTTLKSFVITSVNTGPISAASCRCIAWNEAFKEIKIKQQELMIPCNGSLFTQTSNSPVEFLNFIDETDKSRCILSSGYLVFMYLLHVLPSFEYLNHFSRRIPTFCFGKVQLRQALHVQASSICCRPFKVGKKTLQPFQIFFGLCGS